MTLGSARASFPVSIASRFLPDLVPIFANAFRSRRVSRPSPLRPILSSLWPIAIFSGRDRSR